MSESIPRLNRLSAILVQLQSKRLVTASEIAAKHNVSVRTVYRDIRALEDSGVPIVTEEGKGYSIMEGYSLPPIMFSQEEANALITVEQLIGQNSDSSLVQQYCSAVEKLKAVMRFSQKEKMELLCDRIQVRPNSTEGNSSDLLVRLQSAMINYQVVAIAYFSLDNKRTEREIEPFALYTTQENWILIAFCRLRSEFRAFRLDRIERMHVSLKCFEPHDLTLQEYIESCRQKYRNSVEEVKNA
ncbi:helix-turn-helix transcriptional regulator [Myroides sp. LoEW2-1]|uniref:helix-turn-helix transcriptional regulator n=1 Tax=Myroides sp. LoEW2-1 TaxID=2683192 RepID=UPI001329EB57|nr:YafY family protein [Myroides sp. LoEW2-1]MVX34652.1 WYL domain-containing protein [Myroides sp. LoEW2-1]